MQPKPSPPPSKGGATTRAISKWGQDRRLEFIDVRLRWDGRINRSDLTTFFGISVPQASLDIARYVELAPDNAVYDRSARVYLAGERGKPSGLREFSVDEEVDPVVGSRNDPVWVNACVRPNPAPTLQIEPLPSPS